MNDGYLVYGGAGTGSVAVEATLTLLRAPYRVREPEAADPVNPMRQVPALVLPTGELMTESAAILIHLADTHPGAGLAPGVEDPLRPRFLRWMSFIATQVYALYWVRDDITRLAADPAHEPVLRERTAARILDCWTAMGDQLAPAGRFLLGDGIGVLDVYLAVVSRWGPRRRGFYAAAPGLEAVVRRVDAHPRLAALWAGRYPFVDGWEG